MSSPRPPFDPVTLWLHWLTVLIVFALLGAAWLHEAAQDGATARIPLTTHRSLGVTLWTLTVLRLGWRLSFAFLPPFPDSMRAGHRIGVKLSEYGLYALLLIQPLSGLAQTLARGRAFELFFWRVPAFMDRDRTLVDFFAAAHEIGAIALVGLAGLHAAAALVHYFVLRDDILQSMVPALRERAR